MKKIYLMTAIMLCSMAIWAQSIPLTFETGTFTFEGFAGGAATVENNTQSSGINTSAKVGKMVKSSGETYGGASLILSGPIDFSTLKIFRMKIFSPRANVRILLKVEDKDNGPTQYEQEVTLATANSWVDLSFNYGGIDVTKTFNKLVLIFDFGVMGDGTANSTYLFDDIRLEAAPVGTLTFPVLPVDFESATVDYTFTDFEGGAHAIIANPYKTGINTSDTVARLIKNNGAVFAGSFLPISGAIDFSTKKIIRMKVYSPRIGARVLLKPEGAGFGFEKEVATTKANEWEDMTFNLSAISTALSFNKITIIFDLNVVGDGSSNFTFYVDDIRQEEPAGGGLTQMNMPVTFDDPNVDYGLIGFGGAENSTIITDPTNATNKVARVVKSASAEVWAGTTVTGVAELGFSSRIPFTASNTTMSVRVWVPVANTPVMLKVEEHASPAKSVETVSMATVVGWQNLVFNFANERSGTAALDLAFNYDKASLFLNYGVTGAETGERTYYFDDIMFGGTPLPVNLLRFEATQKKTSVNLSWTTVNEVNNLGFGIERSADARSWTTLQFVEATQSSNEYTYNALDMAPLSGVNYYRLKQQDNDGAFKYSPVRKVDFDGVAETLVLYPNPANGRIQMVSAAGTNAVFTITAANGRAVSSGRVMNAGAVQSVDISRLPAGLYHITVSGENGVVTKKFVVQ